MTFVTKPTAFVGMPPLARARGLRPGLAEVLDRCGRAVSSKAVLARPESRERSLSAPVQGLVARCAQLRVAGGDGVVDGRQGAEGSGAQAQPACAASAMNGNPSSYGAWANGDASGTRAGWDRQQKT
jgi:hypothetical protein